MHRRSAHLSPRTKVYHLVKRQHSGDSDMYWVQLQCCDGDVPKHVRQAKAGGAPVGANLQNTQMSQLPDASNGFKMLQVSSEHVQFWQNCLLVIGKCHLLIISC